MVIVNHCPSSYISRIVLYLVLLYLSKTADWQWKALVKMNFTIREHFQKLIMNPGCASSIFLTIQACFCKNIKKENEQLKKSEGETKKRIENLEQLNSTLNNRVIDLQARSMHNLIFYNIKESHEEDTTEIIKDIIENTLGIENAKSIKLTDRTE